MSINDKRPEELSDKEYEVLKEVADYVTAGGGSGYYWLVNPTKLAKFISNKKDK